MRRSLSILSFFFSVSAAIAQLDTATVSGRVSDATGAVVPNAQILIVNPETNFQNLTKTNNEGEYRVPSLRPGVYRLTVTTGGFKTYVRENIELRVGDNVEVNAVLEVGGTSETVRITATTPQLETETSAGGAVLEGNYIKQLPLYQRNVKATFYLLPDVNVQGLGYAGNLGGFHIAGLRDTNIGYFQDGTYAVANNNGTLFTADPIQSTVEEVKVLSVGLPAEFGHSAGGAMTAVQRTGTNALHGEISEFGRVSAMQHRKFFDLYRFGQIQPGQVASPSELFQQPNATISGPVYLPKVYNGKNKTFFVFAVERLIEKQGKQQAYTVPDAAMLSGDFSFAGKGVTPNQLYDPLSTRQDATGKWLRDPIPGNIIPSSRIDPVAAKFIALNPYAAPNAPGTYSNTGPQNNFQGTYLKKTFWENYTSRIDQQINPAFKLFGNWTYNSRYQRTPNPQISNPIFDSSLVTEQDRQNTATLGTTWIISPSLINETKVGYYRFEATSPSQDYNQNIGQLLGIPNISGALLPGGLPLAVAGPSENVIENFTFRDDMTWIKNKHSFKFGYDLLHERQNQYGLGSSTGTVNNPSGNFSFDSAAGLTGTGTQTVANTGGIGLASFLLGSVSSATFAIPTASWLPRDTIHSFYLQDDWKLLPTLTLNIGVRYMNESPYHTKYNQISQFNPLLTDTLSGAPGQITHPTSGLFSRDNNNFEPRFGLAWQVREKFVIRSSFALSHVDLGLAPTQLDEYSISTTQSQVSGNPMPVFQLSHGPNPIAYPSLRADGTQPYQGANYSSRNTSFTDPNLHNPYTMTWQMDLQYQLLQNWLMNLSYEGSAGVGLIENPQYNALPIGFLSDNPTEFTKFIGNGQIYRPYSSYGTVTLRSNISHSTYHAATVRLNKRLSNGFTLGGFYTFSKSMDGVENSSGYTGNALVSNKLYKARSDFDRTHRFVGNFSYDLPFGAGRSLMNRGGILNGLFGGYTLVWTYSITSGNPVSFAAINSPYNYYPSYVGLGGSTIHPNLVAQPSLRDSWQDLGGDRFNQGNQNSTINNLADFAYPAAYTVGNAGRNIMEVQRQISASISARKEFVLRERLRFQFRFDFQNPFKWYQLGNPNLNVDLKNVVAGTSIPTSANLFGKIPSGNEATTANDGGVPMMNLTLKLVW